MLADEDLDGELFARAAEKLEEPELVELAKAYESRLEGMYPPVVQLGSAEISGNTADAAFLI